MATGLSQINVRASFTINLKHNLSRPSSRRAPTVVAVAQEEPYWATIESEIESYLKKAIPIRSPESVFEPMRHLTFAAPTTTASSLCVAVCELVGGDRRQAMAAAAALHLMHAALYTHEHLLLTDRPRPGPDRTIEGKYGSNIELMTGDGLIPFGMELLAGSMDVDENNEDKILQAIIEITRATGSQGMIDGQYRKLELDDSGNSDPEMIEHVCRKKDGELHACAAVCGAILGGGAGEVLKYGTERMVIKDVQSGSNGVRRNLPLEMKLQPASGNEVRKTVNLVEGKVALSEEFKSTFLQVKDNVNRSMVIKSDDYG